MRQLAVHYTRGGRRVLCGLFAKKTRSDTRIQHRTTCKNCLRVLAAEVK